MSTYFIEKDLNPILLADDEDEMEGVSSFDEDDEDDEDDEYSESWDSGDDDMSIDKGMDEDEEEETF